MINPQTKKKYAMQVRARRLEKKLKEEYRRGYSDGLHEGRGIQIAEFKQLFNIE